MESKLNYLVDKIDKMDEKLDAVLEHNRSTDVTLAVQAVQLAEHIRRTNILEEELKPVKKHSLMVQAIVKVSAAAIGGASFMFAIYKFAMAFLK